MNIARAVVIVKKRMDFLERRIVENPDHSYDKAELSALATILEHMDRLTDEVAEYREQADLLWDQREK